MTFESLEGNINCYNVNASQR